MKFPMLDAAFLEGAEPTESDPLWSLFHRPGADGEMRGRVGAAGVTQALIRIAAVTVPPASEVTDPTKVLTEKPPP